MSILSVFSEDHPVLGLPEISRRTGLSSSTTHRLVVELADWGALARTADLRYRIGPTLRRLGAISPACRQPELQREGPVGSAGAIDADWFSTHTLASPGGIACRATTTVKPDFYHRLILSGLAWLW